MAGCGALGAAQRLKGPLEPCPNSSRERVRSMWCRFTFPSQSRRFAAFEANRNTRTAAMIISQLRLALPAVFLRWDIIAVSVQVFWFTFAAGWDHQRLQQQKVAVVEVITVNKAPDVCTEPRRLNKGRSLSQWSLLLTCKQHFNATAAWGGVNLTTFCDLGDFNLWHSITFYNICLWNVRVEA